MEAAIGIATDVAPSFTKSAETAAPSWSLIVPRFSHLLKARRRSPPWRGGAIGRYTSSKSLFQFFIC